MINSGRAAEARASGRLTRIVFTVAVSACAAVAIVAPRHALALVAQEQVITSSPGGQQDRLAGFLEQYVNWAKATEAEGQERGVPLTPEQLELAVQLGIKHPEKVRLVFVDVVPFPIHDAQMRDAATQMGFIGPGVINNAQAFGYTIWVRKDFVLDRPSLAHELVHVEQIERSASFGSYAKAYMLELLNFGHEKMPLELEAYQANKKFSSEGR